VFSTNDDSSVKIRAGTARSHRSLAEHGAAVVAGDGDLGQADVAARRTYGRPGPDRGVGELHLEEPQDPAGGHLEEPRPPGVARLIVVLIVVWKSAPAIVTSSDRRQRRLCTRRYRRQVDRVRRRRGAFACSIAARSADRARGRANAVARVRRRSLAGVVDGERRRTMRRDGQRQHGTAAAVEAGRMRPAYRALPAPSARARPAPDARTARARSPSAFPRTLWCRRRRSRGRADEQPHRQADPILPAEHQHHAEVHDHAQDRHDGHEGRAERPVHVGIGSRITMTAAHTR
jgi:hypothetical protein